MIRKKSKDIFFCIMEQKSFVLSMYVGFIL